jgi:hypothetical protein
MRYLVVGDETCPDTGRAHWQCYIQFHKKLRMNQVKQIFGNTVHLEGMRGTPKEASDYCKKEGAFTEFGDLAPGKGARTDLFDAQQAAALKVFLSC